MDEQNLNNAPSDGKKDNENPSVENPVNQNTTTGQTNVNNSTKPPKKKKGVFLNRKSSLSKKL